MLFTLLDHQIHRLANAHVAQLAEAVLVPVLHLLHRVLRRLADGSDFVVVIQRGFDERPADVARRAKDQPYSLRRNVLFARRTCRCWESETRVLDRDC